MRCLLLSGGRRMPPLVTVLSLSLVVAGCAVSQQAGDYRARAGAPGQRVAVVNPPAGGRPQPVIEEDGLPSQAAPRYRRRVEPDNPNEPYSPNYGPPPVGSAPTTAPPPATPPARSPAPAAPVRKAAMTDEEANAIIARAIAEHEVRGQ